jgi:hypothetical protein
MVGCPEGDIEAAAAGRLSGELMMPPLVTDPLLSAVARL